jgi:hypothetical protein
MTLLHDRVFPEGFTYKDELLSSDQERALAERFAQLRFREFEFRQTTDSLVRLAL